MRPKLTYFYPMFLTDLITILTRPLSNNTIKVANGAIGKCRVEMLRRAISNYYGMEQ